MPAKRKGAIIGFGFISGKGHFPAYEAREKNQKDTEITAIADICPERRALAQKLAPQAKIYETYEQLLNSEKNLDFVDISTPPVYHAEIAKKALAQGIHVLCEKPLTANTKEAMELVSAAQTHRRVVFPCHNYKHAPVVKTVDEIIRSGEIGKVHSVVLNTFRTTHAKGVEEWKTDWRREKKYSAGGIAMDHGSHTFYLAFDWLKAYPTSVTAKMFTLEKNWDTEDYFSCVLTFPTGLASAHLTWTAGTRKVIYAIQGSLGAITIDNDLIEVATKSGAKRSFEIASHWGDASHVQWFNSMFDQFLACIDRSEFVNSELRDAVQCVHLIEKAYESSNSGSKEIRLDELKWQQIEKSH